MHTTTSISLFPGDLSKITAADLGNDVMVLNLGNKTSVFFHDDCFKDFLFMMCDLHKCKESGVFVELEAK
jgi:hypothetical protein